MFKKSFLILFSLLALLSCKTGNEEEETSKLSLTLGPEGMRIIEVSVRSCKEQQDGSDSYGVTGPIVVYPTFKYQWSGTTSSFSMAYLQLSFEHEDLNEGKYTCTLTADDLAATLNGAPLTIAGSDNQVYTAGCSVRCGGIGLRPGLKSAFIEGTALLYGVEVTDDGRLIPVEAETDISMEFQD